MEPSVVEKLCVRTLPKKKALQECQGLVLFAQQRQLLTHARPTKGMKSGGRTGDEQASRGGGKTSGNQGREVADPTEQRRGGSASYFPGFCSAPFALWQSFLSQMKRSPPNNAPLAPIPFLTLKSTNQREWRRSSRVLEILSRVLLGGRVYSAAAAA